MSVDTLQRPKFLFIGDPHGEFAPILASIKEHQPEAVILLGDIVVDEPFEKVMAPIMDRTQVWWIPGNHDFDRVALYDNLFESALRNHNLHGRVTDIAGVKVAGLGGVFMEKIWHPATGIKFGRREDFLKTCGKGNRWRGGLPLKRRGSIWYEDVEQLSRQTADILVTHEAPSYHRLGFRELDELAIQMGATTLVHGHQHEDYESVIAVDGRTVHVVGVNKGSFWLLH